MIHRQTRGEKALCLSLIPTLAAIQSATAISMLHTTNWNATDSSNPYVAAAAAYDAVGFIQWTSNTNAGAYVGTGTLVHSSVPGQYKILTAAHNVDSEPTVGGNPTPDGNIDADTFSIYFGANTGADGNTAAYRITVPKSNVAVHSLWTNGDGAGLTGAATQYDIAVMTFTLADVQGGVLGITPMEISTANPLGQLGTMVGYGSWGAGNSFGNQASDGIRRAGTNIIDVVGVDLSSPGNTGFSLQTDFDGPSGVGHTTGAPISLPLEASTGGGDSGGPLLVGGKVVGVLNGGFPGTGGNLSEYGDRSMWASLMEPSNQAFLIAQGVVIPEPSAVILAGAGAAFAAFRRRRAGVN